jgi:uncharacterized protein YbjT (DUF2867 family)
MIFLTGATGHTGSRAARALAQRGENLRCLLHTPMRRVFLPPQAEIIKGDASDAASTARAMAGCDACLHLAHIRFAPSIIEACKQAGVERLICMSSTRRYTKFECESSRAVIAGEAAIEQSGLRWTILRPAMIYGGPRDNNLEKIVRYFRKRRVFPLVRGGRQLVQPVFVGDVANAILAALDRPQTEGRAYTLAGPQAMPFREMIEKIAQATGVCPRFFPAPYSLAMAGAWIAERLLRHPPATTEQIRRFLEDKAFDIEDIRRDLDFNPISFEEGLSRKMSGTA